MKRTILSNLNMFTSFRLRQQDHLGSGFSQSAKLPEAIGEMDTRLLFYCCHKVKCTQSSIVMLHEKKNSQGHASVELKWAGDFIILMWKIFNFVLVDQ